MREFLVGKDEMESWLEHQAKTSDEDVYFSYWLHPNCDGFGIVITDRTSGEFHLMPNGDVIAHVDKYNGESKRIELVWSASSSVPSLNEFERLYNEFKAHVIS